MFDHFVGLAFKGITGELPVLDDLWLITFTEVDGVFFISTLLLLNMFLHFIKMMFFTISNNVTSGTICKLGFASISFVQDANMFKNFDGCFLFHAKSAHTEQKVMSSPIEL